MKNRYRVLIGIIVCLVIAVGSYFWATGIIDSNFNYRSPLKDTPPTQGASLGKPATNRVVFVLIDALRYDTSLKKEVMPTLNQLRTVGASAMMHSRPPSFSEPGYTTLLTGAWPDINDGPALNLDYGEIPTFTQDNLFSAAKRNGLKTAISGYYWFEELVPQKDVDFSFYTPGEDTAADRQVVDAALPWLQSGDADLVLIHIDQVDYAGHHEGGPVAPNWDAASKRADDLLAEILAKLDLSNDTIVVLSDHGQIDAGGHGGQNPITLLEPFVIAGRGIKPSNYPDINMVDVAPTLAALLGTNIPATSQGQVLVDMLDLSPETLEKLPLAIQTQQTQLVKTYVAAVNPRAKFSLPDGPIVSEYQVLIDQVRSNRLLGERIWRSAGAALFLAIVIALLIRYRRQGAGWWVIGGLVFLVAFNARYVLLDHKVYSLSSVISEMDLILYVGITSAAAMLIAWLLVMLGRNGFKKSPVDAAKFSLASGLTSVFVLSMPVVLSFVLNGPLVTWTLPEYLTSYLAMLGLIQIIIAAGFTPLLAGISALIAFFYQPKRERTE